MLSTMRCVLCLGAVLLLLPSTFALAANPNQPLPPAKAAEKCAPYSALFKSVDNDLERWKTDGISLELMQRTIEHHTKQKGFAAGFLNGKAYLVHDLKVAGTGHHAQLFFIYMRLLVYLERMFVMPDVDFVISTIDRPLGLAINASSSDEPVFRFCKTDSHADILIPIFHFHMKDFDGGILHKVPEINKLHPWESKKDQVFGRFSLYLRHIHPGDPAAPPRFGAGGKEICTTAGNVTACRVREHFVSWSAANKKDFDVSNGRRISMPDHAAYKYLIHMDGQGLSSRLDQLLPLNSLVIKEESGYRGFYHHLIKPHEHYLPFWKERPEDIMEVLKWARDNDAEAKRIAANGQEMALKYLNKDARACYWYYLLSEMSKILKYKPGKKEGRPWMELYQPLDEYLDTVARAHEGGKAYKYVERFAP